MDNLHTLDESDESPSSSAPSFDHRLSFTARNSLSSTQPAPLVEGDDLIRDIDFALPGDVVKARRRRSGTKRRSGFYEDAFAVREVHPAKERIHSEAVVMADIKTNVIVGDEFTFVTELSHHLSCRYKRPVSSIVVTVTHGACMLYGGTFDPAYVMTITALPSQVQATTNKRNTALIQKHMQDALGVIPSRGYIRFVPAAEELTAYNGKTLAGQMDDLEKRLSGVILDDDASVSSRKSRNKKRLSVRSTNSMDQSTGIPTPDLTPPASAGKAAPTAQHVQTVVPSSEPIKIPKRRKSFVASIFGRSKPEVRHTLPTHSE